MTLRIPAIVILLTALGGALSVAVAAMPVVAHYSVADQVWAAATQPTAAVVAPRLDLTPILDFAPFGHAATPITAAAAAPSDLTLQGVSVSPDPAASRAIIAGGIGDSTSYGIGAMVAQGTILTDIAPDHVTLTSDKGPQTLTFPDAAPPVEAAPLFSAKLQNLMPAPVPVDTTLKTLREQLKLNPQSLLDQYSITATPDGYQIGDAGLAQFGLQRGDLITLINGRPVGDIASDRSFLDEVAASGQATVIAERDGQPITIQVILP